MEWKGQESSVPQRGGERAAHDRRALKICSVRDPTDQDSALPGPTAPPGTQVWKPNVEVGVFSLQLEGSRVEKKNGLDYWVKDK